MRLLVKAFVVLAVTAMIQTQRMWEMELIKIDCEPPDNEYFINAFRIKRVRHGIYGVNGSVFTLRDIDNFISLELKFFYSQLANNQYKMTPMRMEKMFFYDSMNKHYKTAVMKQIANISNFPQIEEDSVYNTPLKKGEYYVKNFEFDDSKLPLPPYIPYGYYKVVIILCDERDDKILNFANMTMELSITQIIGQ